MQSHFASIKNEDLTKKAVTRMQELNEVQTAVKEMWADIKVRIEAARAVIAKNI